MRAAGIVLGAVLVLTGYVAGAVAQESAAGQEAVQLVNVGNKVCPVSGMAIAADAKMAPVTYEYNGKIYNLCCQGCVSQFQKDPQKFSAIADEEVSQEKVQEQQIPVEHKM